MAYVALTSLMATLDLEFCESRQTMVPTSLIVSLDLHSLFLKNYRISHGVPSAAIKELETKIRDFALKADDDIQIQLSNFVLAKEDDTRSKEKASEELCRILEEAAENAKELSKLVDRNMYGFFRGNETPQPPRIKHASVSSGRPPKLEEEYKMVGRQHDYEVIKDRLLGRNDNGLKVISIVGMMGIGKTTLARSVYGDPQVVSHFEVKGWVTMHEEHEESQMLRDLLASITLAADPNEVQKRSTHKKLAHQVCKCLSGKRYLIVLDNIRREYEYINECFPDDENGSCILLTTRYLDSGYFKATRNDYIHKMTLLDPNECWDLFCNVVISLNGCMSSKFKKIRTDVVEKCDGLPHSVVVVAERISKCDNIEEEWKRIEKELESLGSLDRRALAHSYNQLPHRLKACFLYLAVFPKRSEIQVKTLVRLWVAEGFVEPVWRWRGNVQLEDVAYEYLEKLVLNSLLLIGNQSSDGKIKTCRMQSALHSFCIGEVQKEGIFCAINIRKLPAGLPLQVFANSCRWLSLYSHSFDYYVLFRENNPCSILFFHENPDKNFISFKLLRVLAFVPSSFLQRVPIMHLKDLVFLRYLSVTEWFEGLDYVVSNNPNLQTLVVSGNESPLGAPTIGLPYNIWESAPQLRHLEVGNMYAVYPPVLVEKENIQTLSWVSPTVLENDEAYCSFPNLEKLKIFYRAGSCSNPRIFDSQFLYRLEKLAISVLVGCTVILPEQSMFSLQLKKLSLSGTNLFGWDLTVIGQLPWLEVLKLKNAIHGNIWKVNKGGFRRLKFLLIQDTKLEHLNSYLSSFKCLERLVLRSCCCLEEIPWFLAFHLKSIALERCHPRVVEAAMQIQEAGQKIIKRSLEIIIRGAEYDG